MEKYKLLILILFSLLLLGCKNKKNTFEITSVTSISETKDTLEVDSKYIKNDAANHKSFYYDEKFYTGKRTEYYELPQLNNYENIDEITISGVETLNIGRLNLYQTENLNIWDCNLSKLIYGPDSENIINLTISDCDFNSCDIFTHFPNIEDVMLGCKIECIPNLSKNKNLRGIWIFSDTYDENKEMYDKIKETYPNIIVKTMIDGEL